MASEDHQVLTKKHIKFFSRCLQVLPDKYVSLDTSRATIMFFALSGLDMLDSLNVIDKDKKDIIEWIYSLQIMKKPNDSNHQRCGFRGSTTIGSTIKGSQSQLPSEYDSAHVAMTYSCLLSLLILGDDLSRVRKCDIIHSLKYLQQPDGSYRPLSEPSENDMRFLYCACVISYILSDWSGVDIPRAVKYIEDSLSYEGGFGQGPHLEAHGGSTFCAVAALILMDRFSEVLGSTSSTSRCRLESLRHWCIKRQQRGFQGRPNKPQDTCYSFWVGATLKMLGIFEYTDFQCNRTFLMETQDEIVGGFAKWPDTTPDALHAYFGICGLSLMDEPGVLDMCPTLNVSNRVKQQLHRIHKKWGAPSGSLCIPEQHMPVKPPTMQDTAEKKHDTSQIMLGFTKQMHQQFFHRCLQSLPAQHAIADSSRVTVCYFALSALDLLDGLHLVSEKKREIVDWIYSLQIADKGDHYCGFRGSTSSKISRTHSNNGFNADSGHLAMTYSALCALLILEDDFSCLKKLQLLDWVGKLQLENGSFTSMLGSTQADMKFTYCAVGICYMLNSWETINVPALVEYILSSQSHEGGFGQGPGLEAHGGATYCAVSSLILLNQFHTSLSPDRIDAVKRWCVLRQQESQQAQKTLHTTIGKDVKKYELGNKNTVGEVNGGVTASNNVELGGFQGRANKPVDSSYSFWIGASLRQLDSLSLCDFTASLRFLLKCQTKTGGFGPHPNAYPDALHSFFSICALSLQSDGVLDPVEPSLNISQRAVTHLRKIQT